MDREYMEIRILELKARINRLKEALKNEMDHMVRNSYEMVIVDCQRDIFFYEYNIGMQEAFMEGRFCI